MEAKELELIKHFFVQYATWKRKWYGNGVFLIKGCEVRWETEYFETFDAAAEAAKLKAVEVVREFNK